MPRNGAGAYTPPAADFPFVSGTLIESAKVNDMINDMSTALTTSIASDGQTTPTADIPMGGHKITNLALGTASTDAARVDNAAALGIMEFRLTLTTGVPVTTSDVSAASTLYLSPYKGNSIALYDGSNWHKRTSAEMSIAIPAVATKVYDVFCYDNAGVPTLELLVWTNDTTRATALTTQDGVYVKTGATTRRYIGTIRAASDSKCYDTLTIRHVWNYYNRVRRLMFVTDANVSWNYTLATPRQADANTANQFDIVVGVVEDALQVEVYALVANSAGGTVTVASGFGIDSTSVFSTSGFGNGTFRNLTTAAATYGLFSMGRFLPSLGRHFIAWLEASSASGATSWTGSTSSGMQGEILA